LLMSGFCSMNPKEVFVREATGLVREISLIDAIFMNLGWSGPVGYAVAYTIAWVPASFSGANLVAVILLAMVLCFAIVATYGLFSAAMPRSGGDYVWVSRVLSPPLGLLVSWTIWFWTMMWFATATNWVTTFTIVPALANIGFVSNNAELINLSSTLSSPVWVFVIGAVVVLLLAFLSIQGVTRVMAAQKYIAALAIIGSLISIAVLLGHTHSDFVAAFNQYMNPYTKSTDSYSYVISTANQAGYSASGFSLSDTLLALPFGYFAFGWAFASAYVGGEMKRANDTTRQIIATVGGSAVVGLLTVVLIGLLENITGYEFFSCASYLFLFSPQSLNIPVPSFGMFNMMISFLSGNVFVTGLVNILFVAWGLLALPVLFMTQSRVILAWSFDQVFPRSLADVSERYHTPVKALSVVTGLAIVLLGFYTFLPFFFSLFTTTILSEIIFALIPVGIAAVVFPYRKKDLYSRSPHSSIGGIPLISLTGIVMVVFLVFVAAVMLGTAQYGTGIAISVIPFTVGAVFSLLGLLIYYAFKAYRKAHGIDLGLVFTQIPPE